MTCSGHAKRSGPLLALAIMLPFAHAESGAAAPVASAVVAPIGYADLADLALAAPIAVKVTIRKAVRLKDADAAGVAAGRARFYLTGDVAALIAAGQALPARLSWIADVPLTPANRPPKLAKRQVLLLARPVAGKSDMIQLVSPDAQLAEDADTEARLRAILAAKLAADAPPRITGIGHAFHVPGSIPGEGETQIFLKTADERPVSLSVLRRPGETPRWSVSLGEIVSDSAAAPERDTLLWYRLACALPATLPDEAVADQARDDATQARADYAVVIEGLGACGRTAPAA